jgi:ERCC4-type nuclease
VLSRFQRSVVDSLKLKTVGDVLQADESVFKKAKGVANVRARQIHNAAQAAVMEYLSG